MLTTEHYDKYNLIKSLKTGTLDESTGNRYLRNLIDNIKSLVRIDSLTEGQVKNLADALYMVKDEAALHEGQDVILLASNLQKINEDAASTVSVGGGAMDNKIAPVDPEDQPKFANCAVYKVSGDTFHRCRQKKPQERFSRFVGEEPHGEEIRQFARNNPKKSIVLQDTNTGAYAVLKFGQNQWW